MAFSITVSFGGRGGSRGFAAHKSELFKKIQTDSRNQREIQRMIQESSVFGEKTYKFFVDGVMQNYTVGKKQNTA